MAIPKPDQIKSDAVPEATPDVVVAEAQPEVTPEVTIFSQADLPKARVMPKFVISDEPIVEEAPEERYHSPATLAEMAAGAANLRKG